MPLSTKQGTAPPDYTEGDARMSLEKPSSDFENISIRAPVIHCRMLACISSFADIETRWNRPIPSRPGTTPSKAHTARRCPDSAMHLD